MVVGMARGWEKIGGDGYQIFYRVILYSESNLSGPQSQEHPYADIIFLPKYEVSITCQHCAIARTDI